MRRCCSPKSPFQAATAGRILLLLLLALLATGCAPARQQAAQLAQSGGFQALRLDTQPFVLQGWLRPGQGAALCVYIEGDGLAWLRHNRPSSDPTPTDPVALRLALADPHPGPVLYLGRPCQYTEGPDRRGCSMADWTSGRFSARALAALDQAIDQAKARSGAAAVALHGYSGGGTLAALLAARRSDVVFLATVAGNLDHRLWTSLHGDAPLHGSLNPADEAQATRRLPQLHVLGGKDTVIPSAILDAWCAKLPGAPLERVTLPGLGHEGPWESAWPGLLRRHRRL